MTDDTHDDIPELFTSPMAFRMVSLLSRQEMYSRQLTEDLNNQYHYETSRESVSNYLKRLRDAGLIERGKRTQAQYYRVDYEGFYFAWLNYIEDILQDTLSDLENSKDEIKSDLSSDKSKYAPEGQEEVDVDKVMEIVVEDGIDPLKENISHALEDIEKLRESDTHKHFFEIYVEIALSVAAPSTFDTFLRKSMLSSLIALSQSQELPEEVNSTMLILSATDMTIGSRISALKQSIETVYGDNLD